MSPSFSPRTGGVGDRKVTVAVIQEPVATTVAEVHRERPARVPIDWPLALVLKVVEPIEV